MVNTADEINNRLIKRIGPVRDRGLRPQRWYVQHCRLVSSHMVT